MQGTVRTTIRIRKDLVDQSRMIALKKGVSLQDVINDTLAVGFKHVTDLNTASRLMGQIDSFRQSMTSKNVNLEKLLDLSKKDQK